MKTRDHNAMRTTSCATLFFSLLLSCMLLGSSQVMAQSGGMDPDTRYCMLLKMLGGPLPPQCRDDHDEGLSEQVKAQLDALRLATVAFHSFDVAVAAGWDTAISPCVESPMGGMGYHIANMSQLTNDGHLNHLRPEVLLYEPTEDGSMAFVGVEFVVPPDDWPHEDPPRVLGQDLVFLEGPGVWGLHVWLGKENPEGIFADWNPDVNCAFAPAPSEED